MLKDGIVGSSYGVGKVKVAKTLFSVFPWISYQKNNLKLCLMQWSPATDQRDSQYIRMFQKTN